MKKNFDNAGVASFHMELFLMNIVQRQDIIDLARTDLAKLLLDYFDMSPSQQAYIATMTPAFKLTTGNGIAETWESGQYIQFQKDAKPPGDHYKDMVVLDPNMIINTADQSNQEQSAPIRLPISIWIRYHLQ
ncbi:MULTISPECIES: hypothetical protein [Sphingobacterium]|uniref:hypothetical protein n=1 Tax=Sphingobacterium TaxID=28453 RepID=UPI0010483A5A|nr:MULTISPECIES: hypothetical protein [Sphingobacterium]MCW2258694.1 transcriptional regulator CtsR [Sphingobacterium kitahiroshimense]TCR14850.1 hypothetical protein EDF67_101957 [Sphingobacterium sp. JUb78]